MRTAKEHYEDHLAAVYDWMAGGFENAAKRNEQFFAKIGIKELPKGLAVDLGAGSGFQSIPLANFGFDILAVDFSQRLLDDLIIRAADLPVQTVQADILNFSKHLKSDAALIVCMGDTLTHLRSFSDLRQLISDAARSILENGWFVLTFRDYFSSKLDGTQRFIPVRSDENRVFMCFLEYFENRVKVHDLLYERVQSEWTFSASSYPKLRLDPDRVIDELTTAGFRSIDHGVENGMVEIIARK